MGNYHVRFRGRGRGQSHWEPSPLPDELGGLVAKAGIVELAGDDRAVILGILDEAAAKLHGAERDPQLALWRRRGRRLFDTDALQPPP